MEPEKKENVYALLNFKREFSTPDDKEGTLTCQPITFYEMREDGSFENGTTLEEVLRVAYERLDVLNQKFPCNENAQALNGITTAREALEARTKDRTERGVEGTHQA